MKDIIIKHYQLSTPETTIGKINFEINNTICNNCESWVKTADTRQLCLCVL